MNAPLPDHPFHALSHSQQALWFIYQESPYNTAYNMALPLQFPAQINVKKLAQAVQHLMQRHPLLCARFFAVDGVPYHQQYLAELDVYWQEVDTSRCTDAELIVHVRQLSQQPFVLEQGVFRATVLVGAATGTLLLFTLHHIAGDAASLKILGRELLHIYAALADGKTLALPSITQHYADYVQWETELLDSAKGQRMATYWQTQLAGEVPVLQLPTDLPRPPVQTFNGTSLNFELSSALTANLTALAKSHKSTLFNVLLSAYQVLLHRYSGQADIWVGVPTAIARNQPEFAEMVGYLVNPMVVRTQFHDDNTLTFSQLLQQTGQQVLTSLYHQPYPFTRLIDQLQPQRDAAYPPLVQVMFAFERDDLIPRYFTAEGYTAQRRDVAQMEGQFDLSLTWIQSDTGQSLSGVLSYNRDLFEPSTIARLAAHLQTLLTGVVGDAAQSIYQLPLLTEAERALLLEWNQTATHYPQHQTLVDLFEQQVAKTPDNIAVVFASAALTYQELNVKANQLAHYLLERMNPAGQGITPLETVLPLTNPLIAIAVERSLEMVIGLLGILKAGSAYLPIDPSYPAARIEHMLTESAVPILLTQSSLQAQLPLDTLTQACEVICLDEIVLTSQLTENPAVMRNANHLAYVIYTSGSTGKPKGVMIEHDNLLNHMCWMQNCFSFTEHDKILQKTPFSFDASVWEFYAPLLCGATLVLAKPQRHLDIQYLLDVLSQNQITVVQLVPSVLQAILNEHHDLPQSLRYLFCGGEKLAVELQQQFHRQNAHIKLYNLYGPTEACIDASYWQSRPLDEITRIGVPISNTRIYILDAQYQPQPLNIAGELCIAGTGLARGYLNRPELSAEKFIEVDLFGKRERVYITGDLARWHPDGHLDYLGRIDHQVKLRGFRIELGEIEAVLSQHVVVKEAVVTLYEQATNQALAAYVTVNAEHDSLITQLKDWLKARLPDYMVPSTIEVLDKLPITPNGKIDRKALPAPDLAGHSAKTQLLNPTEALLANLWAALLNHETIHRDAHFFMLGGHSLRATQLVARIRDAFAVELPIRSVFEAPVLSDLAASIDASTRAVSLPPIIPQASAAPAVLSFAQQRLWFLNQFEDSDSATYNIPMALRLVGAINLSALQHSLHWLLERHQSLRMCFPTENGQAHVQVLSLDRIPVLTVHDLTDLPPEARTVAVQNRANQHAIAPFDLASGPLFKADWLQLSDNQAVLLLNMHHIISDGWSIEVFMRDWQHAYSAFAQGEAPQKVPLEIQYQDYAVWQRNWLQGEVLQQQLDYWQIQLADSPELLELPTDNPRPPEQSYRGARYYHSLSAELTAALNQLSQHHSVSLFMTLLASFDILLSRYSRQDDICVGSPIANRTQRQTEDLIGFFVNTLVLRARLNPQQSFIELLQQTRHTCLAAYAHQDIPFEMLVEQLQPTRSLSHSPLFQVMLVLQNTQVINLTLPDLDICLLNPDYPITKFDLTLNVEERKGQLHCIWEYATDLFHTHTIERMAGHFEILLNAIVAAPEQAISQLPLLTEIEIQQLQAWNETTTAYPRDKTIIDLFEQQVAKTPDNIAVVFENETLTYQQLNEKANQVGQWLLEFGEQRGNYIPVLITPGLEVPIAFLAIMKTGAAFVPINIHWPEARIAKILAQLNSHCILVNAHIPWLSRLSSQDLILIKASEVHQVPTNLNQHCTGQDPIYVIYTSGSTGEPKGAINQHRGILNRFCYMNQTYGCSETDVVLQTTPHYFDSVTWQLFWPLVNGAKTVIPPQEFSFAPQEILKLLKNHKVTMTDFVPAVLNSLVAALCLNDALLPDLRQILIGGEAINPKAVSRFQAALSHVHLTNAYGPTETAIGVIFYEIETPCPKVIPIGKPIANVKAFILDSALNQQPIGVSGELYIGGACVGLGYLNNEAETTARFIKNPFSDTDINSLYRTGDLARRLPDGNIEFLGRIDHQVKLRGFRIELGEIEAVLSQHAAVKEVIVNLYEHEASKALVAYTTVNHQHPSLIAELKEWLKAQLPDYMVPSHITVLDKLPLTPNGKIDRKALPAPQAHLTDSYEVPRNDIEHQLAQIWSQLLKVEHVSIHDNFFGLGGDSILSIQIVAGARQAGLQLTPRDLFQHQTIAELAHVVRFEAEVDAEQGLITGEVPLTPIQQRFFAQPRSQSGHYNQSVLLQVPIDLDIEALKLAITALLDHHDALRLRYQAINGQWQQAFSEPAETVPVVVEDLSTADKPIAALMRVTETYQQSFNLTAGPLTYLVLCKWSGQARLFWCIHHLVVDGVSWRILLDDLHTVYQQIVAKQRPQLPAKTSSYKAWAERLADYAQSDRLNDEISYWQALPNITLPIDNPTGENRLEHAQHATLTLSHAATEALLKQVPVAYNTQINDILLTALALTLQAWTGQSQCLLDLEGHGRVALFNDIDLSRTVGWFTSIHPVAVTLPAESGLGQAIKAIKEQLRAVPHEGIGHGLLVQRGAMLPRGQILFNYLGQFDAGTEATNFRFANEPTASDISLKGQRAHLIEVNGAIIGGQLSLTWSYSQDCYRAETIERLTAQYQQHLQTLITHCQTGQQGVTPADFPLASVMQTTLDALYQQYTGLQDLYPLSPMQQGMLFHALYEPETGVYFEQMQLTLTNLEPKAFKTAWQHQFERHPIFRSAFLTEHDPILQLVQTSVAVPWREHDWRACSTATQHTQLQQLLQQERQQGFDLTQAPLMRFDLIRVDEQRYVFIKHSHHILTDGWCLPILFNEIRESYLAFKQGQTPQLPSLRPYRDYIAWLQQQDTSTAEHYWQQRLAGLAAPTPLPILTHQHRYPVYQEASYTLASEHTQRLHYFGQSQRFTLNTLIQGAWGLLLSRYSRESNICFGVTVSGRQAALSGIEQMIGLFINTLPLYLHTQVQETVKDYLLAVQTHHQNDNRYAYTPLFKIQQLSEVPNGTALFDSLLVFENYPLGNALEQTSDSFQIEAFAGLEYTNYPLTIVFIPGESLQLKISYDCQRISQAAIERLWGHLSTLLMAMVDNPQQAISALPMLTEAEIQQLQVWNETATDYPQDKTIVDLFEQQVARTPDNIALVFEDESLTYRQLNEKSNQLAYHLLTLIDSPTKPLIAIAVQRSLDMIIGLLGILKAGGAYVPIEPNYPVARIQSILQDSAAPILLTQSALKAQLSLELLASTCEVVYLDDGSFTSQPIENPIILNRSAKDLAYVIYTSGSTGTPKGVVVCHQAVVNLITWVNNTFQIGVNDRVLFVTSVCFDLSVYDIFGLLSAGGSVHIASQAMLDDPQQLLDTLYQQPITFWDSVPAFFQQLVPLFQAPETFSHALRLVFFSGDWIPVTLPDILKNAFPGVKVISLGGATEATVWSNYYPIETVNPAWISIPYGKPIQNAQYYILDAHLNLCPIGVPGTLYISGICLANGYTDARQTEQRFIPNPFSSDATMRLYHTGDLARWFADGNIEFLGRLDNQVKLRGFRIELGEIQTLLTQHKWVKEAIVVLYEADNNKQLVAYITTLHPSNELVSLLTAHLQAYLPDYMIPSHISVLDKLPLTPNGKIDRKALPAPTLATSYPVQSQLLNPTEVLLASLWTGVLRHQVIHRDANFFEFGGHSLLATQLIARIRDAFEIELPIRSLFENPVLSQLAASIDASTRTISLPPITPQSSEDSGVLSFAQQRLWFFNEFEGQDNATYNIPVALRLSGDINLTALQHSLHWLLERHHSLRTCFPTDKGQAQVQVLDVDAIPVLTRHDLTALSSNTQTTEVQNWANQHAIAPFNLANGPLFKADLLQLSDNQAVLLLNMHHIISDGWSTGVFFRDWQYAYSVFAQGEQPQKAPLEIQYQDYAAWQRQWLQGAVLQQQLDYWQTQLAGIPELLELPTDKPRPPQQSYQGANYVHSLNVELTTALNHLSQQHNVSLFMTLLASFDILLSRYSRQDDICVGSPIANRTQRQTEDLIGFFVNTLVLRAQLNPDQSFIELLQQTRHTCLAAYAQQDIPFEMLVEQLQPTRSLSHSPLFQVMLALQNNQAIELTLPNLNVSFLNLDYPIAKFDLTLNVAEREGKLHCFWEYATDLFDITTIERMAGHFEMLLNAIVTHPERAISQLPILTEAEIQQLQIWNDTARDYPKDKTIVDLFEQQVANTPDSIAVVFEDASLTYRQLNEKANQLAHYLLELINRAGTGSTSPTGLTKPLIAIAVDRSLEMLIGLLGILKAGGAYVPIDPSYPTTRIEHMLTDSAAPILLTQSALQAQLPLDALTQECAVICLDEMAFDAHSTQNPTVNRTANDWVYVIYTSGSTGKPKGVMIEQYSLLNFLLDMQQRLDIGSNDQLLAVTTLSFDIAALELFLPIISGSCLHLVTQAISNDGLSLQHYLAKQAINVMQATPATWQLLKYSGWHTEKPLNILCGGEALSPDLANYLLENSQNLWNVYGPTETTIWSTIELIRHHLNRHPAIGIPISNTRIYILNTQNQPQPPTIPGELCIAGTGLARGYLNRPELTAEKFIEVDLFGKKERIYKTGDLARWLDNGHLEYLGRIDQQVKLRGFRIELGEIETVLSQHAAVKASVVIMQHTANGKNLVAYLTLQHAIETTELRHWLQARLPDYMVPMHFEPLDALPLTPNGKIDRKYLEKQASTTHFAIDAVGYVAPRNSQEELLISIWQDVLPVEKIGVYDNFFELGGHSLLATQVITRIHNTFNVKIPVRSLFEYPVVSDLATYLELMQPAKPSSPLKQGEEEFEL